MDQKNNYPDAVIYDLAELFAQKDSNAPGYLSGPKLVALFNKLGFADSYIFPGVGITTPESSGISRLAYAKLRLSDLNINLRIPEALSLLTELTGGSVSLQEKITAIFEHYHIPDPTAHKSIEPEDINNSPRASIIRPAVPVPDSMDDCKKEAASMSLGRIEGDNTNDTRPSDSVFDEIPPGVKVVFISYSWDNDEHQQWVLKLANDLAQFGIYVLLDKYLPAGYPLPHFMSRGLDISDKVIIVGTPEYKEKSISSLSAGVVYEDNIIRVELMRNIAITKFLPILRRGTFDSSLPTLISRRVGFDFRNDAEYSKLIKDLARELYDVPKHPRPALGPVPVFEYNDLSSRERESLKNPESDFRKQQDRKWLDRLLGNFSFRVMDQFVSESPIYVDERVFISIDIWNAMINSSTFRIYDPELSQIITDFHNLWHEATVAGYKFYSSLPNAARMYFHGLQNDIFVSQEAENTYNKLVDIRLKMQPLLRKMASYIQDHFEIDVEKTSEAFEKSLEQ